MAVFKFMGATFQILKDRKDLGENWGLCKYGERRLLIAKGLLPRQQAATLIHEMAHAVFDRLGLWKRQDEMKVQRVEGIIEAILRDNPELVRGIIADLAREKPRRGRSRKR